MDNETRQKIQKLEDQLSQALDIMRKLSDTIRDQSSLINELRERCRANEQDIQILKDGGNI